MSKTLADVAAEPEVNNRHGAAKNAAPKFEPILDPKAQQHFRVAAGSERNEDPAHRELLAVAAKANEKPHIPDQSHPVLSGNTGAFKELEALTSDLHKGTLTPEAFGQRVSKVFTDRGLPPIKVEPSIPLTQSSILASYQPGHGKLEVAMRGQPESLLLSSMAHELTHAEQDVLVMRSMMDDQHVGKKITSAQATHIKEQYKKLFNADADDKFIHSVADARQGKHLNKDENERAQGLIASNIDWLKNPKVPGPLDDLSLEILKDSVAGNGARGAIEGLIERGGKDPVTRTLSQMFFNKPSYSREDVVAAFGDPSKPDFDEKRAQQLMNGRIADAQKELRAEIDTYKNRKHEAEAYGVQGEFDKAYPETKKTQCNIIDGKMVCRDL